MRLMQAVHAQQALLLDALDGDEAHVRAAGGLADGGGIVGVVLAAVAFAAVGRSQVRRDDAGVQPHGQELARPVMSAGADLHHHHAAGGQLRTPGQELLARERTVGQHMTVGADCVNLNDTLGQVHAYANGGNLGILAHGLPLSRWL